MANSWLRVDISTLECKYHLDIKSESIFTLIKYLKSRFDVNNTKPNPVVNFEGVSKNVMAIGFEDEGRWMYTGLF